jgi:stringent starvation protein B
MTHATTGHEKRDRLLAMLEHGLVMIHLDPRQPGVIVPPGFRGQAVLRLNLAWGFNLPALDVGDEGIYAILSFNRQNFACTLPWPSVFALTWPERDHDGAVWSEDVPPELRAAMGAEAPRRPEPARPRPVESTPAPAPAPTPVTDDEPRLPPLFIVHEGGRGRKSAPAAGDAEPPAPPEAAPERPRLRLVKG